MATAGRIVINLSAGTGQFIVDMEKANAKLRDFASGAKGTGNSLDDFANKGKKVRPALEDGAHGAKTLRQESNEATASLALLSEQLGVKIPRHLRTFIASLPGVGAALSAAFSGVAVVGLIYILDEVIERAQQAYEWFQKAQEAPARFAASFDKLNDASRLTNDELQVTNDKLADEIAKLEGKPGNGLKLALDEARVAADKLATSLSNDFEELAKLFKEENIGGFKGLITGRASTTDFRNFLVGESGLGGQKEKAFDAKQELKDDLDRIEDARVAGTYTDKEASAEQEKARLKFRTDQEKQYKETLARSNQELKDRTALQAKHDAQLKGFGGYFVPKQELNIGEAKAAIANAKEGLRAIRETAEDEALQKKKGTLEKTTDTNGDPLGNELKKLDAEIRGLNAELKAVGLNEAATIQAKAWAEAQKAIAQVNKELRAQKRPELNKQGRAEIEQRFQTVESINAEKAWRESFVQSSHVITERIAQQYMLADAIGKGYEAQKRATVETQLIEKVTPQRYNDPAWMRAHKPEVDTLRSDLGTLDDAERNTQTAKTLASLTDQIALETRLAGVEREGSAAVRQATLDEKLDKIAKDNSTEATQKLTQAETTLFAAQEKRKVASVVAQLDQEIAATNRLTAAQIGGAEAVRKAQLENRIEQIKRDVKNPADQNAEIQRETQLSEARHQADITSQALSTGIAYQNQLDSIDEQITALEQLKATQGDTLAIEISLKELEQERAKVWADQVSVLGSARDGLKAFFHEMAVDGESAAKQVHDALKNAFDSINDELSKIVSGQKASWQQLLQGISQQLAKMALQRFEATVAQKIVGTGQPKPSVVQGPFGQSLPTAPPFAHGVKGVLAQVFGLGKEATGARDGQSPGTAIFVTMAGGPSAGTVQGVGGTPPFLPTGTVVPGNVRPSVASGESVQAAGDTLTRLPSGLILRQPVSDSGIVPEFPELPLADNSALTQLGDIQLPGLVKGLGGGELPQPQPFVEQIGISNKPDGSSGHPLFVQPVEGGKPSTEANQPEAIPQFKMAAQKPSMGPRQMVPQTGNPWLQGLTQAGIQIGTSMLTKWVGSQGDGSGSASQETANSGGGSGASNAPGAQPGDVLTRDPSGLIIRNPQGFAKGGDFPANKPMIVGEKGPELLLPKAAGTIVPNHKLADFAAAVNGGGTQKAALAHNTSTSSRDELHKKSFAGFFAEGGTVQVGKVHVVGEEGPELFLPKSEGAILPNREMKRFGSTEKRLHELNIINRQTANSNRQTANSLEENVYGGGTQKAAQALADKKKADNKSFAGFFAQGGTVKPGKIRAVGEEGPELFVPESHGTIIPNHKLGAFQAAVHGNQKAAMQLATKPFGGFRAMGGSVDPGRAYVGGELGTELLWMPPSQGKLDSNARSGGNAYYTINAQGTDPVQTEQRVRAALVAVHGSAVRTSSIAQSEHAMRTPQK